MRIALGLDILLSSFARQVNAETWRKWGGADWKVSFLTLAASPDVNIFWNLTDVLVAAGVQRAAANIGGPTDWELLQFYEHPEWWPRTAWFRDGQPVACPWP